MLRLRKLAADYDVHGRIAAIRHLLERQSAGEIVTGLLYVEREAEDLRGHLNTMETPLKDLSARRSSASAAPPSPN